jgi:hypothetical protein
MARLPRRFRGGLVLVVVAAVGGGALGGTFGAFTSSTSNAGNTVTAAPDFSAPTVTASAISRTATATPGFIRQGSTYHVYANVTDSGNPASGVSTVTADVSQVTGGQTAVPLTSGSFTVGGVSYNYRSAQLTANASLSEGSKPYSVTATDGASNSATRSDLSVTVDNTAPTASDVQAQNNSSIVGRAQPGDTMTLTFSEPIEPSSVVSGWNGGATNVVVRMINGGLLGLGDDDVQIYNAGDSAALPLGRVDLRRPDYVTGLLGGILKFGATGTASTMTMSGNSITITLGTQSAVGLGVDAITAAATGTMNWPPSASATDRAGNAVSTTAVDESGAADKEF